MYALTLWQPWAHIVATGEKRVENRPWEPPFSLLGKRFAIHAGKHWDQYGADKIYEETGFELTENAVVFGAIVATVKLLTVVTHWGHVDRLAGEGQNVWFTGPFGWVLNEIHVVDPPYECCGYQKLWKLGDTLSKAMELV